MNKEQLGRLLAELRKRENISQKEMAEKLGIVPSTLCKWEQGHNCPDLTYLTQITNILHVSYEDIMNPERTLQRLSENTSTDDKRFRKHPTCNLVIICSCIVLLILLISFCFYQFTYL